MFTVFLRQQLSRRLIGQFFPVERSAAAPGPAINLVILALMIVGLVLALWPRAVRRESRRTA